MISRHAAELVEASARQLRSRGLVAAADVVADTRRRHEPLVGDAAADGLRVAGVVVGAEDAERGVTRLHAALELLEAALVHVAERLDVHGSDPPRFLSPSQGMRGDRGRKAAALQGFATGDFALAESPVLRKTPDGFEPP